MTARPRIIMASVHRQPEPLQRLAAVLLRLRLRLPIRPSSGFDDMDDDIPF
jgi:hypothetical protein